MSNMALNAGIEFGGSEGNWTLEEAADWAGQMVFDLRAELDLNHRFMSEDGFQRRCRMEQDEKEIQRLKAEVEAVSSAMVEMVTISIEKLDRMTTGNLAHNSAGLKGYLDGMGVVTTPEGRARFIRFQEGRYDELSKLRKALKKAEADLAHAQEEIERFKTLEPTYHLSGLQSEVVSLRDRVIDLTAERDRALEDAAATICSNCRTVEKLEADLLEARSAVVSALDRSWGLFP